MVGAMTHSDAYMKERSYRVTEALRHQNQREQRRLEDIIGQRNGIEAKHRHEMSAVSKEQERIRRELARIKQTISTTWGVLPARNPEDGNISSSSEPMNGGRRGSRRLSRQDIRTRNEEDQKSTEDRLRRFNDTYPLDSHTRGNTGVDAASAPPETAAAVDEARDAISRRLTLPHISADEVGATPRVPALLPPLNESDKPRSSDPAVDGATVDPAKLEKQKRDTGRTHQDGAGGAHKDGAAASQEFDGARYNPDGQVRTMHTLPNLEKSLKEAKKTRYVRHKKKQWFETELSINEVFHNIRPQT